MAIPDWVLYLRRSRHKYHCSRHDDAMSEARARPRARRGEAASRLGQRSAVDDAAPRRDASQPMLRHAERRKMFGPRHDTYGSTTTHVRVLLLGTGMLSTITAFMHSSVVLGEAVITAPGAWPRLGGNGITRAFQGQPRPLQRSTFFLSSSSKISLCLGDADTSVLRVVSVESCVPERVHVPFTREEDALLWAYRDQPEKAAQELQRGRKGVLARLRRLADPSTEGHRRLFGANSVSEIEKSARLSPARDCFQRIIWDPALDQKDFIVAYRDRFKVEPQEVRFDCPNKSVSGAERLLVLAIPEHRIEYIKFRRRLVWHKELRIDRFFGTRDGLKINEVVDGYESWFAAEARAARSIRARALECLDGDAERLAEVMRCVRRARTGACAASDVVHALLSDAYFGLAGGSLGVDGPNGRGGEAKGEPVLWQLFSTLPEEQTALREELLEALRAQLSLPISWTEGPAANPSIRLDSAQPRASASRAGSLRMLAPADAEDTGDADDRSAQSDRPLSDATPTPQQEAWPQRSARKSEEEVYQEALREALIEMQKEGERNGAILMGLSCLSVAWYFSVPPDIRRSKFCQSGQSVQEFVDVFGVECVQPQDWGMRVLEHYQTCGAGGEPCVHFDFSVDPQSVEAFYASVEAATEWFRAAFFGA